MTTIAANHPAVRAARSRGEALRDRRLGTSTFRSLVVLLGLLNFLGTVMVLSASSVQSLDDFGSSWGYFKRHVLWLALGLVALVMTTRTDYRWWAKLRVVLIGGSVAMLVVVLTPLGVSVNGSQRWLGTGLVRFQPSEVAKLAVLVFSAHVLAERSHKLHNPKITLGPVLAVLGVVGLLVMLQPDLGTTLVIGGIVLTVLWAAGTPMRWMTLLVSSSVLITLALGMSADYRRERLLTFLNPWADPQNTGYQIVQSLVGLGSGGITGVGLGASRAKWGFLPNAHTDFIFAIIGEELGLIGAVFVVGLFVTLGVFGVRAALHAPDRFGLLLAAGITTWILAQAFVNIGAVIGMLPVTGVPLPFISFGGSSLVATMAATGILLNIARQGRPRAR